MTESHAPFRSVMRGYDPAQVDRRVRELEQAAATARQDLGERTLEISSLETAQSELRGEVERHAKKARALEEAQTKAVAPTYATLGDRIGSILTLADKEASELRARAAADAASRIALADESARTTRLDADHYAAEVRSAADVEATLSLEDAERQAESLLDDADRRAVTRREEAEAVYEQARADSAIAAVDFETKLAARRDASALEFAGEVTAAEHQLTEVRLRSEESRIESELAQQDATSRSVLQLEQAKTHALKLITEAKTKAEHIRGDSERELSAATQRRDSINIQLSNVRQMIASLGGAVVVNPLELADPAAGQPRDIAGKPKDDAAAWQPKDATPSAWQPRDPSAAWHPKDTAPSAWQVKDAAAAWQPKDATLTAWHANDVTPAADAGQPDDVTPASDAGQSDDVTPAQATAGQTGTDPDDDEQAEAVTDESALDQGDDLKADPSRAVGTKS